MEPVLQQEVLQILISVIVKTDILDKPAILTLAILILVKIQVPALDLQVDQTHLLALAY